KLKAARRRSLRRTSTRYTAAGRKKNILTGRIKVPIPAKKPERTERVQDIVGSSDSFQSSQSTKTKRVVKNSSVSTVFAYSSMGRSMPSKPPVKPARHRLPDRRNTKAVVAKATRT